MSGCRNVWTMTDVPERLPRRFDATTLVAKAPGMQSESISVLLILRHILAGVSDKRAKPTPSRSRAGKALNRYQPTTYVGLASGS